MWFPYAFWACTLCIALLSGTVAWLQHEPSLPSTAPAAETVYYPLPAAPADPAQLQTELAQVDMYAVALLEPENLRTWLQRIGPRQVLDAMYSQRARGKANRCHQAAHLIGHEAFSLFGPDAFAAGNEVCQAGYYHGVTERLIDTDGIANVEQRLMTLCASVNTPFATFQCYHGAGHGIMGYLEYDLPKALEVCGTIAAQDRRKNCYGGVFMENIVAKLDAEADTAHQTAWLNNDPQFPCNVVNQNADVQESCYSMQSTWLNVLADNDLARISQFCTKSPPAYVGACMQSIGRDITGKHDYEPKGIAEDCAQAAGEQYLDDCVAGATKVIMDFYGANLGQEAVTLCSLLPVGHQEKCFRTVYDYSERHFPGRAAKSQCPHFPKAYQGWCI